LPALVAVGAVCLGLSLYAGVASDALATSPGPDADPALDAVHDHAAENGVVDPDRLASAPAPDGRSVNATLVAGERRWTAGPTPTANRGDRASRTASVRLGPGRIRPGRLRVVVW
jgi:hypothetical protein